MKNPNTITKVIFRKFHGGDVIALFPEIPGLPYGADTCSSYMHVGQHGAASLAIVKDTRPALEHEYKDLKEELGKLGYRLRIIRRFRHHHRIKREVMLSNIQEALD